MDAHPPELVSELIDATSATWDRERVAQDFLPMDVPVILSISLCTRNIADFLSWLYENTVIFLVRSAYAMLVSTRRRREAWLEETVGSSSMVSEVTHGSHYGRLKCQEKYRCFCGD